MFQSAGWLLRLYTPGVRENWFVVAAGCELVQNVTSGGTWTIGLLLHTGYRRLPELCTCGSECGGGACCVGVGGCVCVVNVCGVCGECGVCVGDR